MSLGYGGWKANTPSALLFPIGALVALLGALRLSQILYPTPSDKLYPRVSYIGSVLRMIRDVILRR